MRRPLDQSASVLIFVIELVLVCRLPSITFSLQSPSFTRLRVAVLAFIRRY
jgi:hypothetical protein